MQDFRNLKVWHKAHALALEMYSITDSFPRDEIYGITSQIRRAAVSIPNNIAEGCGRSGMKYTASFYEHAFCSANELDYLLLLSFDLKYITHQDFEKTRTLLIEVKKMLSGLLKSHRT